MLCEVGGLFVNQDRLIPHDYFKTAVLFQEWLKVINDVAQLFKLGAVGEQRTEKQLLITQNPSPFDWSAST